MALNVFFVEGNPFFCLPYSFKMTLKQQFCKNLGITNDTSSHTNSVLRPHYNRYFCHITIIKWSQTFQLPSEFFLGGFKKERYIFSFISLLYCSKLTNTGRRKAREDSFGNGIATVIKCEGVKVLVVI